MVLAARVSCRSGGVTFEVDGAYEVKATVTVRARESRDSAAKKDLKAGAGVRILEFGQADEQRVRVAGDGVEGWVSLSTKQGKPFLGLTAEALDQQAKSAAAATAAAPGGPLEGWAKLERGPAAVERQPGPPGGHPRTGEAPPCGRSAGDALDAPPPLVT